MPSYKAADFIKAIPGSGGIITTIARRVGCDWITAKRYITEYPTVRAVYDSECESVLDAAESVIISDIVSEKNVQTAKWYVSMKGRQRGYAETQRQEITGADGGPVVIRWPEASADD